MAPSKPSPMEDEDALPLDIVYSKLVEWLIERKQLRANWHEALPGIKEQMTQALGEMPEVEEISTLLMKGKKQLHYYHCRRVMELLEAAQDGKTSKNWFGQYTNALLRSWSGVLKAYERENVYLGEAARILNQNAAYTCPSLKRSIAQHEKQIHDYSRKIVDYQKTIKDFETRFKEACRELQIEGIDFRSELLDLTKELPGLLAEVEGLVQGETIEHALQYHKEVQEFLHAQGIARDEETLKEQGKEYFTMIRRVRRGEKLQTNSIGTTKGDGKGGDDDANAVVTTTSMDIDWSAALEDKIGSLGMEERGEEGAVEIDWGIDTEVTDAGIDWADDAAVSDSRISTGASIGDAGEITAAVTAGGSGGGDGGWQIEVEEAGAEALAEGEQTDCTEGDSLLFHNELRGQLLNDLLELEAFLRQRLLELGDEDNVAFVGQYQGAHVGLQQQSVNTVDRYLDAVMGALNKVRAKRLQQLLLLRSSSAYVDRVVNGLRQKLDHISKLKKAIEDTELRREETLTALGHAIPEYEATAAATRTLKKNVEASLSKLLKGRRVNIMGEINTL